MPEAAGAADNASAAPLERKRVQFGKYSAVGLIAFAIDYAVLIWLKSFLGWPAWGAAAVAFAVSTVFSFIGQKTFTFQSPVGRRKAAVRYGVLLAVNMAFTSAVVELFDAWGLYLAGKVIATALTTLWTFPLMRHWVYPRKTHTPASGPPA